MKNEQSVTRHLALLAPDPIAPIPDHEPDDPANDHFITRGWTLRQRGLRPLPVHGLLVSKDGKDITIRLADMPYRTHTDRVLTIKDGRTITVCCEDGPVFTLSVAPGSVWRVLVESDTLPVSSPYFQSLSEQITVAEIRWNETEITI